MLLFHYTVKDAEVFWSAEGFGRGLRTMWDLEWTHEGLMRGYGNIYNIAGKKLGTSYLFNSQTPLSGC